MIRVSPVRRGVGPKGPGPAGPGCAGVNAPGSIHVTLPWQQVIGPRTLPLRASLNDMVAFDDEIAFGDITKGDFSSPPQKFVTPCPLPSQEGPATPGITPPHKTPAQWGVLEASKDFFDRRGKRLPSQLAR